MVLQKSPHDTPILRNSGAAARRGYGCRMASFRRTGWSLYQNPCHSKPSQLW